MKTSEAGIELIKKYESFMPRPYVCPAGKLTIGYGHVIGEEEDFTEITKDQAHDLLVEEDLPSRERTVYQYVRTPLTQSQFDALVSLVYNIGATAFKSSTLLRKLNSGDIEGAADEFMKWVHAGGKRMQGLVNRREAEREMFLGDS